MHTLGWPIPFRGRQVLVSCVVESIGQEEFVVVLAGEDSLPTES